MIPNGEKRRKTGIGGKFVFSSMVLKTETQKEKKEVQNINN